MKKTVLSIDLGAESGRVMAVHFDGQNLRHEEIHRFANVPVMAHHTRHWDILRLWRDIQDGIAKARTHYPIA
jgi:sugar (pentulose or hexulose) kinase